MRIKTLSMGVALMLMCVGALSAPLKQAPVSEATACDKTSLDAIGASIGSIKLKLQAISQHMGKTPKETAIYEATTVPVRSLYYQASRLYKKLYQLEYEVLGIYAEKHEKAPVFSLCEVESVLIASSIILDKIENHLKINQELKGKHQDIANNRVTLFYELITLNQLANQLLEVEAQPRDVYQNITLAIYYAGGLVETMPNVAAIIKPAQYEPNLKPADVYQNLFEIYSEINSVYKVLGLDYAKISRAKSQQEILPNDVESLSALVLAELYFLCEKKGIDVSQFKSYYPGKKYPSDVYQRSTMLMKQILAIKAYVEKNPDWLIMSTNESKG